MRTFGKNNATTNICSYDLSLNFTSSCNYIVILSNVIVEITEEKNKARRSEKIICLFYGLCFSEEVQRNNADYILLSQSIL